MATEIQSLRPSIGEFNISAGSNDAYAKMGQSIKQIGQLAQAITDPIAEGIMSEEAQTNRLAEEENAIDGVPLQTKGTNPIFGLTKWGKSYAEAYNTLDTQLIAHSAVKQLNKASIEASKPEALRGGATIGFDKAADEIIQGYTSVAHGDKTKLRSALLTQANKLEMSIAQKEEEYALGEMKASTDAAFADMGDAMFQAGLDKDAVGQAFYAQQMKDNLRSRFELGFIHEADMEQGIKKIDASVRDSGYLATVLDEVRNGGNPDKALADIAKNPPPDMTYLEHQALLKNAKSIIDTDRIAQAEYHALEGLQLEADMAAGKVEDKTDLLNYDLTPRQMLSYEAAIDRSAAAGLAKRAEYSQALVDIESGQGGIVDKSTISSMTDAAWKETQQGLGRALTLEERYVSITGGMAEQSTPDNPGLYIAPASGVLGLSLGTNDPSFDRVVSSALTSEDPRAMYNGYLVYQSMITKAQPNTLNLDATGLRAAISMRSLIEGGADPVKASELTTTTILKANETGISQRLSEFQGVNYQDRLPSAFKAVFGADADKNRDAYGRFINMTRANFAQGSNFDDAVEATAMMMKNNAKSEYFPPGYIGQSPPEMASPALAFEIKNQLAANVQNVINAGATGQGGKPITWANPAHEIDLTKLNPEDLVTKPLLAVDGKSQRLIGTNLPEIMIDGHISKVYLIPGPRVEFGDDRRPIYNMVYFDKIGMQQPITDGRGPNMAATFSPVSIDKFAPNYLSQYNADARRKELEATARAPATAIRNRRAMMAPEIEAGVEFSEAEARALESEQKLLKDFTTAAEGVLANDRAK